MPKKEPKAKRVKREDTDEEEEEEEQEEEEVAHDEDDEDDDDDEEEEKDAKGKAKGLKKNESGEQFVDLSGKKRLTVRKFKNSILIDIREVRTNNKVDDYYDSHLEKEAMQRNARRLNNFSFFSMPTYNSTMKRMARCHPGRRESVLTWSSMKHSKRQSRAVGLTKRSKH